MRVHRLLTLGPSDEPLWVRLYIQSLGEEWAAMIVADGVLPPEPEELKGTVFFGATAEEAEALAKAYLALNDATG